MPDEPSLHDVLRGSLAHHAEQLGDPSADITTVWSRVDRRRARRRSTAVVGSVVAVAAGAAGIMLVANPSGSTVPLDGSDGAAALAWACTGPLGSDGTYDYFETCDQRQRPVASSTTPVSIVASTIADPVVVSTTVPSAPPVGTAPPTTAFSPFVGQQHVVVEGDSVDGIGAQFGVDPEVLADYNGWPEGINRPLVIGEQVQIPPNDDATVTTLGYVEEQHEVAPGDSLTAIAEQYGIDLDTLVNYNAWPEGRDHVIRPGDVVLTPPYGAGGPPPITTAIVSMPQSSTPFVTNVPTCESTVGDIAVTVPCGTVTASSALTSNVVATGPSVAGTYRCTDPLGKDSTYQYYASCDLVGVPTSSVAGTVLSVSTTTTTTTIAPPTPASTVPGDVQTVVDPQEQLYVAVAGDSLTSIAERYGIDVDTLVAYNGWAEGIAHPLVVGETVKIPPVATLLGLG